MEANDLLLLLSGVVIGMLLVIGARWIGKKIGSKKEPD